MDDRELSAWIGRTETQTVTLDPTPAQRMSATLGGKRTALKAGDSLPALWHWLYFATATPREQLGADGHSARGGFLPPSPLPRRMWAGGRFAFHTPLRVGDVVGRVSTIEHITHKQGKSGALMFVTVRHDIQTSGATALVEHHDIVYRDPPPATESSAPAIAAPSGADWRETWTTDSPLLFRYSALTFNAHRIHYDHPYATQVEGYPGLVVHGPLLATLMMDVFVRYNRGTTPSGYEYRAMAPLFCGEAFVVAGRHMEAGAAEVWVERDGGTIMRGTINW